MQKLVLVSVLLLTVAVPAVASLERLPALGLRKVVWWMVAGIACYVLAVMFVYPLFPA